MPGTESDVTGRRGLAEQVWCPELDDISTIGVAQVLLREGNTEGRSAGTLEMRKMKLNSGGPARVDFYLLSLPHSSLLFPTTAFSLQSSLRQLCGINDDHEPPEGDHRFITTELSVLLSPPKT